MKKIFRKSNIFSFLLGAVLFSGITVVVAATILAKDVSYTPKDNTWKVDNVKDAIDDLYTKAKPEYTGSFEVTPQEYATVIPTKDTILTKNIRVNAIPSTYKNLTTTTTVNANNLLNGIKAYTSDGTLVTGNITANCVSGSYTKPANTFIDINIGFMPTKFSIEFTTASGNHHIVYYNSSASNDSYNINIKSSGEYTANNPSLNQYIANNNKIIDNTLNTTAPRYLESFIVYYMACK